MTREAIKLLHDILRAASKIRQRTFDKTLQQYQTDEDLQLAVERLFTIAGEAAMRLRRHAPEVAAKTPEIRGVIAFRNFLMHVYDAVEPDKVWQIIVDSVPKLEDDLKSLLAGESEEQ